MDANTRLVAQDQALSDFFESLMRDVDAYAQTQQVASEPGTTVATNVTELHPSPLQTNMPVTRFSEVYDEAEPLQTTLAEDKADISIYERLPDPPDPITTAQVESVSQQSLKTDAVPAVVEPQPAETTRPQWAAGGFQVMLFKVAGLNLAVPLVELNGVIEWDADKITSMPGHAEFYLGLIAHLDKSIPVIDTARLVLPEDKRQTLLNADTRQCIKRVVLIDNSRYGLACDEVDEVITLSENDVRWRSSRTQRKWLLGTVIEHMCALVDATAFSQLLATRAPVSEFRES